jgi:SAM-dependent methyltransferase
MPSIAELRSFYRRRIQIPVGPGDRVLDVGSGDKPHWRADVLLDRYPDSEHRVQRSGAATARTTRPLFDADITDMPFADGVFDYAICSHVLEHVLDPAKAMEELMRVAKAGYIELPEAGSARVLDFPSHLWWCRCEDGVLSFEAKTSLVLDAEIDRWARSPEVLPDLERLMARHLTSRLITFPWSGRFRYRVDGSPTPELLSEVERLGATHRARDDLLVRALTWMLTLRRRKERPARALRASEVLKPQHVPPGDPVLERRRYRIA